MKDKFIIDWDDENFSKGYLRGKLDVLDKISTILEKHYKCTHHTYPSMNDPHGCTDCYNQGLIIDDAIGGDLLELLQNESK